MSGLTRNETIRLLAVVAAIDGVDTDDPLMVSAWQKGSEIGRWESYEAAEHAFFVYRDEQPDYPLRPGHITRVLERVRRTSGLHHEVAMARVPDHVHDAEDFGAAYLAWIKEEAAANRAKRMTNFVDGGDAPRAIGR